MPAAFAPARDALGHRADLAHRATFPLLGVPVEIQTNSPGVIAAAERAFGDWRCLPADLVASSEPAVVSVVVHPLEPGLPAGEPRPFMYRAHGGRFVASDGINMLTAQYGDGRALAFIAPEMLERGPELRLNVLQLLALLLVTQHDRVPVHAGAVVREGLAIVLAGRSTAGKSTLCYACVRDGFSLLAEDAVYVSREPALRLWGLPGQIHLLPDAVRFFPELAEIPAETQPNGKFKLAVDTTRFGPDRDAYYADRAIVCIVARHAGAETLLEPVDPDEAVAVLSADREPGFDLYQGAGAVAEGLVAGGAYRLIVGHDFDRATKVLRSLA